MELVQKADSWKKPGFYAMEPFRLCESNLTKLETQLLENNNEELVDDFMETLRYALVSTINLKGAQITQIILRGGILRDTTNLSDPFSLDIELLIILQSESYSLAEMTFELADYIYGEILDKKRILFFCTILSNTEWKRIKNFENNEYLILVEGEGVL